MSSSRLSIAVIVLAVVLSSPLPCAEPTRALPGERGDDPRARADALAEENKRRRVADKDMSFEVKKLLEAGRHVGGPAAGAETAEAV